MNRYNFFGRNIWGGITTLAVLFSFSSCEKTIHINLSSDAPVMVVEGGIQTGTPPVVLLTTTFGYTQNINLQTLENGFIHGADVKVFNGTDTVSLREYTIDTGSSGAKFYFYTVDTANLTNAFVGEVEKTYTLVIKYNGKTFTAVSKIPNPKPVDTIYTGTPLFINDDTPPNALQLFVNYKDPDTLGNAVVYATKRNSQPFIQVGVYNDDVINGQEVNNINLDMGYVNDTGAKRDSLRYLYPGDTVQLQWSSVDRNVFKFWNTYYYAGFATGNPFSTPINVQTNMTGGALGIWAGYGTTYRTLVVPH